MPQLRRMFALEETDDASRRRVPPAHERRPVLERDRVVRVLGAGAQARGVDVPVLPHQPGHVLGGGLPVGRPGRHAVRLPLLQAALAPPRARAAQRLRPAQRPRLHRARAAARLRPPLPRPRRRRRVVRPHVHRDHGSAAHQDVGSRRRAPRPARPLHRHARARRRDHRGRRLRRARPLVGIAQPVRTAPHVGGGVEGDADAVQPRHVRRPCRSSPSPPTSPTTSR